MGELDPTGQASIDFSSVLAAAVHDMKNSLCLLLQSIETLAEELPQEATAAREQVASFHYEASRLNTNLVQILSLYRSQLEQLPISVDECFVEDLFNEVLDSNRIYTEQKGISVALDCDPDLSWYLDPELIFLLINDALVNALRYGTARIIMHAGISDNQLQITIEDDGSGYPDTMLKRSHTELSDFHVSQGRTGLGLFFARLIATAHVREGKSGEISLSNGGTLGGSVFMVKIP